MDSGTCMTAPRPTVATVEIPCVLSSPKTFSC